MRGHLFVCFSASSTVCVVLFVCLTNHLMIEFEMTAFFYVSASSPGHDDADVERQLITTQDPPTAAPDIQPVKEENKVPEQPNVEPTPPPKVPINPADECTALLLEPLQPSTRELVLCPEKDLQPSEKPRKEGADKEKPADVTTGHQDVFINNDKPVCEAEKQLWATVEETTAETGAERGMESSKTTDEKEEEQKEKEEGVIGG